MMFNTSAVFRLLLVTGGAATWAMVGCSGSEPTASNALSQEASIAAALEATEGSLATAEEDAKSCFETYRACKVAEAADVQSCRAALKACLPAEAPAPRTCGGDHPRHGGDGRPPATMAPVVQAASPSHQAEPPRLASAGSAEKMAPARTRPAVLEPRVPRSAAVRDPSVHRLQ
ncbi:MAG TPA: hypothetical protein VFQ61_01650 [Polyangiaceae bacterium]|nr:hypothetical protein [Polyangiaceae bacterium]